MNKHRKLCCLTLFLLIGLNAYAQLAIPTLEFGAKKVKEILGDAESAAQRLLYSSEMAGNRLLADGAIKLDILTQNLRLALAEELDTTFDRLDENQRNAVITLNAVIEEMNSALRKAETAQDNLSIDLDRKMENVPFFKDQPFYIRRVTPTSHVFQNLPYVISITGKGLETGFTYKPIRVVAFLNGTPVAAQHIQPVAQNQLRITVPHEQMNPLFAEGSPRTVALFIRAIHESRFPLTNPDQYDANILMVLHPRKVATLHARATKEEVDWEQLPSVPKKYEYLVGGQGNGKFTFYEKTELFPANWRVHSAVWEPTGDSCRWCCNWNGTGLAQNPTGSYYAHPDTPAITFKVACNGDPCVNRWIVSYQQKGHRPVEFPAGPPVSVSYGETFSFDLPEKAVDWIVLGEFFTGEGIRCSKGACSKWLEELPATNVGPNRQRISFRLKPPV